MRTELLPGTLNVLRFPAERRARPTLALLREIAPDMREVWAAAEAFLLTPPPYDLRHTVDADAAEHIANHAPAGGPEREAMLTEMLDAVVLPAVAAVRAAHDARVEALDAQQALLRAQASGGFWIEPLRERSGKLGLRLAELLVTAHAQAEMALGVARAVDLARRGETWMPYSIRSLEAEVFGLLRAG